MSHTQSAMPCNYCPEAAAFVVEFRDDDEHRRACRAHFADAYDEAERMNTQSFLPVYVGRLVQLVTT
jgi:hypothetical protein